MSVSGISFSGLSSQIDTDSIIKQLLAIDSQPIQALQQRQQTIQTQQTAIGQVNGLLASFQAAAAALDSTLGFSPVKASVVDNTVANVTASAGAQAGTHTLVVNQLAQAQKLGAAAQTSQTAALGVAGQIVINGKAINVASTDTLQTIAANINSAQAGATASIVSTAANAYTLVLASANSGAANALSVSDTAGGAIVQNTLGLVGAGTAIHNPITGGAASNLFTDSATSIGTLIGLTSPQSGTIQINGQNVTQPIDFSVDSLSSIASKINASGIAGVSASIVSVNDPVSGVSKQQLQIAGATSFTDSNNILTNLGVLQNTPTNELAQAKDAKFSLDGLNIVRSSNTVSDVLSGTTFNLLKDGGSTTQFTVSADTDTIKQGIQNFVNSYNQIVTTIGNLTSFDPQTLTGGTLFGDVTIQNVLNQATDIVSSAVAGLTGSTTTLGQIGISMDQTNQLSINDSQLTAALTNNLQSVAQVFQASGVATDSGISFIGATQNTKASTGAGYAINISQVATQAGVTAGTAHSANDNPDTEILTFNGTQFGSGGMTVSLAPNSSLDDIVSQINANASLAQSVTASNVGGKLVLTAAQFGSAYNFTVSSSQAAAANNSGIGTDALSGTGQDVAGTINGEAATGKGQILTGNSGNLTTDGLQLRVTATLPGDHGTIAFSQGIAAQAKYFGTAESDPINGELTLYSNGMNDEVTDIQSQISDMQDRLNDEESYLRQQFTAMETSIANLRAGSQGLAGLSSVNFLSSTPSTSSSSSSSSSSSGG